MPKFNPPTDDLRKELERRPDAILNAEGGLVFEPTPLTKLYMMAATCLVKEPQFYRTADEHFAKVQEATQAAIAQDPEFVLKLAVYCREQLYLRSMPLFLVNEVAYHNKTRQHLPHHKGPKNASLYVARVIQRADEITELAALAINANKDGSKVIGKMPMMLKKGLRRAFNKFDEYQFSKYDRTGRQVKLKDVLFLVRPEPKNQAQQDIFDRITHGTLAPAETWERKISTEGATKEAWESIFPRMGYMAILRNLRNFLKVDISETMVEKIYYTLTEPKNIRHCKQFPFRFQSAYRMLKAVRDRDYTIQDTYYIAGAKLDRLIQGVEVALDRSVVNLPKLAGTTAIFVDTSASMDGKISGKSFVRRMDISTLFGSIARYVFPESSLWVFGSEFMEIKLPPVNFENPQLILNGMRCYNENQQSFVGHSTDAWKIMQHFIDNRIHADRIVLFSDEQLWDSDNPWHQVSFSEKFLNYRQRVNPNVVLYSYDLAGYGHLVMPEDTQGVYNLSGFSDKVFQMFQALESKEQEVLDAIRSIRV